MKTILLTGATGFVGRHLVENAILKGHTIIASVRENSNIEFLQSLKIPLVNLSLNNPENLKTELLELEQNYGSIDIVIHNAGLTQSLNKKHYDEVNFVLSKNLINSFSSDFKSRAKFIYISSLSAVGSGNANNLQPIKEDDIAKPLTFYGESKLKTEQFIIKQSNLNWIILRPTAVYGPYERNLFNMINSIKMGFEIYIGSKEQMLSFIHVYDLANVILDICEKDISNEVFNISDGEAYSAMRVNQIIKSILKKETISFVMPVFFIKIAAVITELMGHITKKSPILNLNKLNELKQLNWMCNNSKLKNSIDFSPKYKLDNGMKETIKWYKENGWL